MRYPLLSMALLLACATEPSAPPPPPVIESAAVSANLTNVLAATVAARVRGADSVRVLFHLRNELGDSTTPVVVNPQGAAELPVLGLLPDQTYRLRLAAFGPGGRVESPSLEYTTGALPADLPSYQTAGSDPSPGYIVFAAGAYGLAIDNTGRVVWYYRFPNGPGLNFMTQPNGRYVARPPPPTPGGEAPWVEIDPTGRITRSFGCAGGLVPRFHDLIRTPDDSYWIMCDDTRQMDLSGLGGDAQAKVTGTEIQHLSADGTLLFQWSPFDHFDIADLDPPDRNGSSVNWTHGNAIALDRDGNLLVSFRSLSEVTLIDVPTGAVRWRLGGPRSDFVFLNGGASPFARQHGLRVTGSGQLLLLDNSGTPGDSRVQRYSLDLANHVARLEWSRGDLPPVVAGLGGSVQELLGGRVLVAFGNGGRVAEFDADGTIRWRIVGPAGYVFRAQRILSLYRPGVGTSR